MKTKFGLFRAAAWGGYGTLGRCLLWGNRCGRMTYDHNEDALHTEGTSWLMSHSSPTGKLKEIKKRKLNKFWPESCRERSPPHTVTDSHFSVCVEKSQMDSLQPSEWWGRGFQAPFTKCWHTYSGLGMKGWVLSCFSQVKATRLVHAGQKRESLSPKMGRNGQEGRMLRTL